MIKVTRYTQMYPIPILDRLTNPRLYLQMQIEKETLLQIIRRDLENLLNTKVKTCIEQDQLSSSNYTIINYGIPNFTHTRYTSKTAQEYLCKTLQIVITQFEKRLNNVLVTWQDKETNTDLLTIRIEAELSRINIEPKVTFESYINPFKNKFTII